MGNARPPQPKPPAEPREYGERTGWYQPHQKPCRPGVYETCFWRKFSAPEGGEFSRWDGNRWSIQMPSVEQASRAPMTPNAVQGKHWRGLTA